MTDTIQILQPIVVDSLSVSTIPVDVNLVDSVNNIVLQFKDSIPVTFVDKTAHNWFQDHLTECIAFGITFISLVLNICQAIVSRIDRKETRDHEKELKKLETEEHRREQIHKDGIEIQCKLYKKLLELDDLSLDENSRRDGKKANQRFKKKISDVKIYVRTNRLYIPNELIQISEYLIDIYNRMGVDVDSSIYDGLLTMRQQYEAVFKDDEKISNDKIDEVFNNISKCL